MVVELLADGDPPSSVYPGSRMGQFVEPGPFLFGVQPYGGDLAGEFLLPFPGHPVAQDQLHGTAARSRRGGSHTRGDGPGLVTGHRREHGSADGEDDLDDGRPGVRLDRGPATGRGDLDDLRIEPDVPVEDVADIVVESRRIARH